MSFLNKQGVVDRLETAAKARSEMLARFRARPSADDPAVLARFRQAPVVTGARGALDATATLDELHALAELIPDEWLATSATGTAEQCAATVVEQLDLGADSVILHGATPAEVVHQLRGIQDGHPAGVGPNAVLSVPDGVARAMSENYLIEGSLPDTRELPIIGACPDCGSGLTRQEGCVVCHSCGYSKCS